MGRSIYKFGFIRLPGKILKPTNLKFALLPILAFLSLGTFSSIYKRISYSQKIPENLIEIERPIEAVAALGQIRPIGETRFLAAPTLRTGGIPIVANLLVEEGDSIKVGQSLVVFDHQNNVLSDLNISKARLDSLKNNIKFQQVQVSRYQKAADQGATPINLLELEKDKLNQLKGKHNQLIYEIKGLEIDLNKTTLRSPINGIVLKINYREGERPGVDGVLQVGRTKLMEALIEVYESDINRVYVGQEVYLISENGGFEGKLIGTVNKISPKIEQRKVLSTDPTGDADARIVEVIVTLEKNSSNKVTNFTGMKVIARFKPK